MEASVCDPDDEGSRKSAPPPAAEVHDHVNVVIESDHTACSSINSIMNTERVFYLSTHIISGINMGKTPIAGILEAEWTPPLTEKPNLNESSWFQSCFHSCCCSAGIQFVTVAPKRFININNLRYGQEKWAFFSCTTYALSSLTFPSLNAISQSFVHSFVCLRKGAIHHIQPGRPCDRSCGEADVVSETPFFFCANTLVSSVLRRAAVHGPSPPGPQERFYPPRLRLCGWNTARLQGSQKTSRSLSFRRPVSSLDHPPGSFERTMSSVAHLFTPLRKNVFFFFRGGCWELTLP